MDRVWIKNKETGAVRQVAVSAVPVMAVSGWKQLTKAEVAAHIKRLTEQRDERATNPRVARTDSAPAAAESPTEQQPTEQTAPAADQHNEES